MKEEAAWRTELKWWLSSFATLMPILLAFRALATAGSFATTSANELDVAGVTDRYGAAVGLELLWPISVLLVFFPFLIIAALGFRLLLPADEEARPRALAVAVATWPLALGAGIVSMDPLGVLFFAAIGAIWGLTMPLPGKTLLSGDPIKGGLVVGLAFGSLLLVEGVLWGILWCAWRIYKGASVDVVATAAGAAVVPVLLLVDELRTTSIAGVALDFAVEVVGLIGVSVAAVVADKMRRRDARLAAAAAAAAGLRDGEPAEAAPDALSEAAADDLSGTWES